MFKTHEHIKSEVVGEGEKQSGLGYSRIHIERERDDST